MKLPQVARAEETPNRLSALPHWLIGMVTGTAIWVPFRKPTLPPDCWAIPLPQPPPAVYAPSVTWLTPVPRAELTPKRLSALPFWLIGTVTGTAIWVPFRKPTLPPDCWAIPLPPR